jgi:hypothetical protein
MVLTKNLRVWHEDSVTAKIAALTGRVIELNHVKNCSIHARGHQAQCNRYGWAAAMAWPTRQLIVVVPTSLVGCCDLQKHRLIEKHIHMLTTKIFDEFGL